MRCSVLNCESKFYRNGGLSFFLYPKEENQLRIWIEFSKRTDEFKPSAWRMCFKHFKADDIVERDPDRLGRMKLKKNAVPTLCPPLCCQAYIECPESVKKLDLRDKNRMIIGLQHQLSNALCDLQKQIKENEILQEEQQKKDKQFAKLEKQLEKSNLEKQRMEESMRKLFTPCQINHLTSYKNGERWSEKDINNALTLYSISPKAYKCLKRQGFPYPHICTLNRWSAKNKIKKDIPEPKVISEPFPEIEDITEPMMEIDDMTRPLVEINDISVEPLMKFEAEEFRCV